MKNSIFVDANWVFLLTSTQFYININESSVDVNKFTRSLMLLTRHFCWCQHNFMLMFDESFIDVNKFTGSLIEITRYFCWYQHNFMLMSTNVLLISINITYDRIGNMLCWHQQKKGKTEKKEKKRWFRLEVLGRHYKSLESSTIVTLFKGIFVVNVPKKMKNKKMGYFEQFAKKKFLSFVKEM